MTKIRKCLITLIVLLTVLFSQSRMVNQKPLTEQIHENIQKALLMNQFSEGARPIDEIQQIWSDDDQWENYVRYTYEYSLAKRSAKDPNPFGLVFRTKWTPDDGISWAEDEYTKYEYNDDGTVRTATTYKSADDEPVEMIAYEGPFHHGIATIEISYTSPNELGWQTEVKTERIFNSDGYPTRNNEFIKNSDLEWSEIGGWTTEYYIDPVTGEASCPLTYTEERDPNDPTGKRSATQHSPTGVTDIVPTWKEEYTYGQESCTNDVPPYMKWLTASSCSETYADLYGYDYDTASLEHWMYKVIDYNADNCLASETATYNLDGRPSSRSSLWYSTSNGNYPNKLSTAYDNSETRLIRAESSWWSGLSWNNSSRSLYAYEGMSSLNTEDNSLDPIGFELKQNYPNPFNPTTSISYELPQESNISIKIYNTLGHEIRTLVNEYKSAGQYQVTWDGISNLGERLGNGTYFFQLTAGDFIQTRKMVLLK